MEENNSAMGRYEMDLIRHIAAKALVESDRIDIKEFTREEVETALWGAAAEASLGVYMSDPAERDLYEYYDPKDE